MTDLLTRAWNSLTPEQRPDKMIWVTDGYCGTGFYFMENDPQCAYDPEAAYDRLCVACERVLRRAGHVPRFNAKGQWSGGCVLEADRWGWDSGFERIAHTCRLTAAVLAIEATKGGDDER